MMFFVENFSASLFTWQTLALLNLLVTIIVLIDIIRYRFIGYYKIIWFLVVLFFGVFGAIAYLATGRKEIIKNSIQH